MYQWWETIKGGARQIRCLGDYWLPNLWRSSSRSRREGKEEEDEGKDEGVGGRRRKRGRRRFVSSPRTQSYDKDNSLYNPPLVNQLI